MSGTTPAGIADERQAAGWVRDMFGRIAPRYDLLNHLLSFNIDRLWRARTVRAVRNVLNEPGVVIDLACGTGDLTLALMKESRNAVVLGSDFCHPMLQRARAKSVTKLFEADALKLPVRDASVSLLTIAFGFRNLANYEEGLREMRRVLAPGGVAAILEFSQPRNRLSRAAYGAYSRYVLPKVGGLISGQSEAYAYLPESVRKFPGPEELAEAMKSAGFSEVRYELLTFGIAALHVGCVE